ncbi:ATP-binding protein [Massilia aurea]|jgi:signal transduction histidine kinase/CheY-like chemotaxis protein|uniref:hybrid sensor histidine kinase/response regulator n=1 Tax=Massilia aurea TaxID=373040 RepID=UPI0021627A68|nr:ATP-binding protein [Massilia aurea]MCS0705921.1 ATP-binding protein [Massilia aurea]
MTSNSANFDEDARLAVLDSFGILDTPPERSFDDVVRLVSQLLDAPIAAVNLIARGRQWFKSEIGLGTREMPLDNSICRHALLEQEQMIVPDTRDDPRFSCNPLVTADGGLRFYAGAVLRTRDGVPLGTLCVLDKKPRPEGLTEQQQFMLTTMAHQVMSQIELRRALTDQEALNEALRRADQRKDEFLAMLAHELRNPLAPIVSAATMLSNFELQPSMVQRAADIIARQAGHMTSLIDDLLDVSRVTRGKVELEFVELDLKDVLADAVEQVRPLIEKHGHRLVLEAMPAPALVVGDRKRLVQVMTNLLSNAAKYTLEGGRIEVRLATRGALIDLTIRDDGIGMSPELIASAFDLFSQGTRGLDRSQGGLGIGLALVRSLLKLHGGEVTAASDGPGCGSTFRVTLPLSSRAGVAAPAIGTDAPQGNPAALRIGVVDDNEDAAVTLALLLETLGHTVSVAHSARAALEALPAFEPDVCLLDIGLPEMNGFELARALRARPGTDHAILIAVTGYAQEKDRAEARAAGFHDLFAKPVDLEVLGAALVQIERRRR